MRSQVDGVKPHHNKGRKHTPEHVEKTRRPLEKNGRWRGGRRIDKDGYVLIKKRDHPNANNCGYVREHRLVMEVVLGRYLRRDELVHHINANKQDNRPENLMVLSHVEHQRLERIGKKFPRPTTQILQCDRCGGEFHRPPAWKAGKHKYCSWGCRYPKAGDVCVH